MTATAAERKLAPALSAQELELALGQSEQVADGEKIR